MKSWLLIILLSLLIYPSYSQSYKMLSTNTLYVEARGLGILYSVNYDKVFNWPGKRVKLDVGIGGTYLTRSYSFINIYTGQPAVRTYKDKIFMLRSALLYGKPPFLAGLGMMYFNNTEWFQDAMNSTSWWGPDDSFVPYLNFRYQPQTGGLFYALNVGILFTSAYGEYIATVYKYSKYANDYIWPGFCIGYTFRGKEARKAVKSGK